ncbi:MAG: DNA polymerase III subunit alpha [Minisyncoccia bacterium]|jgi:DNA polymerase-3 subunit alpha
MPAKFAHLHVHSHYSLLGALPKIPQLVERAASLGCDALALTDLGNLYGAIEFYKECRHADIKPIIGLEARLENDSRILLYVENEQGYKNLLAIVTESYFAPHDGKPTVTKEMLARHHEGLIAAVPRIKGANPAEYKPIFGEKNFYTDVALHEIFYMEPNDRRAWETLRAIENRGVESDTQNGDLTAEEDEEYFFPARGQMEQEFTEAELAKTLEIAGRCNLELTLGKFIFPEFPLPEGVSADEYLRALSMNGLKRRGFEGRQDMLLRLNYELDIIAFKGYAAYFLVVEDLIRFAREHGIYTTIRGSVAGSMTTYLLHITTIDPLAYNIPFERFLNPERPSAPDIDMDFADNRRDEVIEYARKKYGEDHVAQIGTFGTMLARGVVRDVARALGLAYGVGDRIAKEIPFGSQGFPMTLDRALTENAELSNMYKAEPEVKDIIDLGKKIEGCARHISVHAAGVVIAPKPLIEYAPLQLDPKGGKIITQYDMYSVGEDGVGLTKFDFLGIRNLSILAAAVKLIKQTRGEDIDIETIPIDDKKTYDMLTDGQTEGTFQLNGSGMTRFLKELKPSTIHDINAMVALFRPGPMQFIPQYIERKHNPVLIRYMDKAMEPILKQTYGILVYQDDLLIMAHELAGYTWGEVDKFRKAVGKKIPAEMEAQKEKFIKGCVEHSKWPRKKAEATWAWIEPFAAYGFNKAHAASYGKVAYQTAYLKANYPVEYMAAVLTAEAGDIDTVSLMVAECKRMGVPVLPPDVNESFGVFTVIQSSIAKKFSSSSSDAQENSLATPQDDAVLTRASYDEGGGTTSSGRAIRFGLYSIKNFGTSIADSIIKERGASGKFGSLGNFLSRVKDQTLNKRGLESLIQCGALDHLGERGQMLASIELLLQYHRDAGHEQSQDSLFVGLGAAESELKLPPAKAASQEERLAWEKELLGLYVSGHPLDKYKEKLNKRPMTLSELKIKHRPGMLVVAVGMIQDIRIHLTKNGDPMAFIKIADFDGSMEAVVFPKNYAEYRNILKTENCIALKGKLTSRNGELSMVAEALKAL